MLSKKSFNAINALVWLGLMQAAGPVSLQKISEAMQVSISSLEQIFSTLKACDLIVSFKGPGGGYATRSPLTSISLWSIAKPFEVEAQSIEKNLDSEKKQVGKLSSESIFEMFQHASVRLLSSISLQEALDLCQIVPAESEFKHLAQANRFKLKPVTNSSFPKGPNSVFNWAQF